MADLTRAMLYRCLMPGGELFIMIQMLIKHLIKATAQTIAAMSSTVSQYIITSNHSSLPFDIWKNLPLDLCGRCQKDENSSLAFAILFTALAVTLFWICRIISHTPTRQIHTDTIRLHTLERAITRQIEINYHLSRPSQNRQLQNSNCNTADFEQWALHWSDIQRFREQAEADFKQGAPTWYYDNQPDCARRYHELRNEVARLHSLGRNIVNAREEARRYYGSAAGEKKVMVVEGSEGWMRRKVETLQGAPVDEMDTRGRSGNGMRKAPLGKAVFQQQVDTIGRLTPGGRFG